jgi:hypothetical protein
MDNPCVSQKTTWLNSDPDLNDIKLKRKSDCFDVKPAARKRLKTDVRRRSQSYHVWLCVYTKRYPLEEIPHVTGSILVKSPSLVILTAAPEQFPVGNL